MAKRLYTEACIQSMQRGSSLVLGREAMATPAALDLAFMRGISVRYSDAKQGAGPGPQPAPGPLKTMLENDGTYVVEVRAGVPTIHRLTPEGPRPVDLPGARS